METYNYPKLIDDFCSFLAKEYKSFKVDKKTSHWYLKFSNPKIIPHPSMMKIFFNGDQFIVDDYTQHFKFNDFKEFKNKTIEIINSKEFQARLNVMESFCYSTIV